MSNILICEKVIQRLIVLDYSKAERYFNGHREENSKLQEFATQSFRNQKRVTSLYVSSARIFYKSFRLHRLFRPRRGKFVVLDWICDAYADAIL